MAIYHFSIKTISRSAGRTATAAAAYRSCEKLFCDTQGVLHDYTKKRGLVSSEIFIPKSAPSWASNRETLWNRVEAKENRKNSTVAREFEIALPAELNITQRKKLASDFAKELVEYYGFVADVCIHDEHHENKNYHAHILCTTRSISENGFTQKTRTLDEKNSGDVEHWRKRWAQLANQALIENGHFEKIDHRTLKEQGIDREPTKHLGATAMGYERRTGKASEIRRRIENIPIEKSFDAEQINYLEKEILLKSREYFLETVGRLKILKFDDTPKDLKERFEACLKWALIGKLDIPETHQKIFDDFTIDTRGLDDLENSPRTMRALKKAIESTEKILYKSNEVKETNLSIASITESVSIKQNPIRQPNWTETVNTSLTTIPEEEKEQEQEKKPKKSSSKDFDMSL
jgi:ATP-dependent exoDNAse (exonuclease V) alpha subunit